MNPDGPLKSEDSESGLLDDDLRRLTFLTERTSGGICPLRLPAKKWIEWTSPTVPETEVLNPWIP